MIVSLAAERLPGAVERSAGKAVGLVGRRKRLPNLSRKVGQAPRLSALGSLVLVFRFQIVFEYAPAYRQALFADERLWRVAGRGDQFRREQTAVTK